MVYTYTKNAEGLYVCPDCDKVTEKQNTMHYHRKTHEKTLPFECKLCPATVPLGKKQFLQAQTLANHVAAKHSSETTLLACPECSVKSLTKANRIIHYVRNHCSEALQQSTLTCAPCGKVCKSGTAYAYHLGTCKAGPITDPGKRAVLELLR